MTPRTLRAEARACFDELAVRQDTPTPGASQQRGEEKTAGATDLMARVRALYEDSIAPVHEIAACAGVTERTIYKYAQRHGWRPRYRWLDDHPCMRGRGWQVNDAYAPAKGAGGRFIRRADACKPFARGLKAHDPAGRTQAQANCAETARLASEAQRKAAYDAAHRAFDSADRRLGRAMAALERFRKDCRTGWRGPDAELERRLVHAQQVAAVAFTAALKGLGVAQRQYWGIDPIKGF